MTYQLYQGDCLDFMRTLDAGSVDAVITDPPYGIDYDPSFNKWDGTESDYKKITGDDKPFDPLPFLGFKRVIMFGANYYSDKLPIGGWIIWDKRTKDHLDAMIGKPAEIAWCNIAGEVFMIRAQHGGVVNLDSKIGNNEKRFHPTQKPVTVMARIVNRYTRRGDTIFDPFMGSGSTGVACMQLGRNFIGCEIDAGYFKIAEKRISEAAAQPALFTLDAPKIEATQAAFV